MDQNKKYIMTLDQGTTSSRCIIFDKKGEIKALSKKEIKQIYPKAGWVEHDPVDIWSSQLSVAIEAMASIGIETSDIEAIAITNQRESTVVWDKKTGKAIYKVIVWQCRRTADYIDKLLKDEKGNLIREKTGLIADAYFSASKIAWILDNVEGARQLASEGRLAFGTIDTWLIWNLTKGASHLTDYTNASRTMLFNIDSLEWDEDLLKLFDIPKSMLAKVQASSSLFAYTDESIFGKAIPIYSVCGDQQAALFGQLCTEEGNIKNTYGTGCFMLMNTGSRRVKSEHGLIATLSAGTSDKEHKEYALEGSVFIGGALMQWLRDEMELIRNVEESEELARSVKDSNGLYIVPAFVGMGAPYWDQYARGLVTGITRGSKRAHFVRAGLEAIAYQSADLIEAMKADSKLEATILKVDGGASANSFLLDFQADILGINVIRPKCLESTALGAAFLAGLSSGFWKDKEELKTLCGDNSLFKANMEQEERTRLIQGWKKSIYKALEENKK